MTETKVRTDNGWRTVSLEADRIAKWTDESTADRTVRHELYERRDHDGPDRYRLRKKVASHGDIHTRPTAFFYSAGEFASPGPDAPPASGQPEDPFGEWLTAEQVSKIHPEVARKADIEVPADLN